MYVEDFQLYKSCYVDLIEDCTYTIYKALEEISHWGEGKDLKSKCAFASSVENLGMLFTTQLW